MHPGMTQEQAKKQAISNLKMEALQRAGVSERISSNRLFEDGSSARQSTFYETTFSELNGEISYLDVLGTNKSLGENNEFLICVRGQVHVMRYEANKRNPCRYAIDGLKAYYENQDALEFSISVSEDAYFWIFYIDKSGEYALLYPRHSSHDNFISRGDTYALPSASEDWTLTTEDPDRETNQLLIVFSAKYELTDSGIKDFNSWSKWYQKLDVATRTKFMHRLIIVNQ